MDAKRNKRQPNFLARKPASGRGMQINIVRADGDRKTTKFLEITVKFCTLITSIIRTDGITSDRLHLVDIDGSHGNMGLCSRYRVPDRRFGGIGIGNCRRTLVGQYVCSVGAIAHVVGRHGM